jgi:hypothetical protein
MRSLPQIGTIGGLTMNRTFSKSLLAIACFLPLATVSAPAGNAQACSASQVAGKWAAWTNGNVNGIGPRVSAGIFTLDTVGNVTHGKATSSLAGTVISEVFSGTYSVNPDCTGELLLNIFDTSGNKLFTATLAVYFDDGGQELRGIYTSAVTPPPNNTALLTEIVVDGRKVGGD